MDLSINNKRIEIQVFLNITLKLRISNTLLCFINNIKLNIDLCTPRHILELEKKRKNIFYKLAYANAL